MYVHTYHYMYIFIYIHVLLHIDICAFTQILLNAYIYIYIDMFTCTHIQLTRITIASFLWDTPKNQLAAKFTIKDHSKTDFNVLVLDQHKTYACFSSDHTSKPQSKVHSKCSVNYTVHYAFYCKFYSKFVYSKFISRQLRTDFVELLSPAQTAKPPSAPPQQHRLRCNIPFEMQQIGVKRHYFAEYRESTSGCCRMLQFRPTATEWWHSDRLQQNDDIPIDCNRMATFRPTATEWWHSAKTSGCCSPCLDGDIRVYRNEFDEMLCKLFSMNSQLQHGCCNSDRLQQNDDIPIDCNRMATFRQTTTEWQPSATPRKRQPCAQFGGGKKQAREWGSLC